VDTIQLVAEFHQAFGLPCGGDKPALPRPYLPGTLMAGRLALLDALMLFKEGAEFSDRRCLRLALITEELSELAEAFECNELEDSLDALVDLRYVLDGTVVELGLHTAVSTHHNVPRFQRAFRRVHAANMAKLGADGKPIIDGTGKIKKPEGWTAQDLADLVV